MNSIYAICSTTGRKFVVSLEEQDLLHRLSAANPHLGQSFPLPTLCPVEGIRSCMSYGNSRHVFLDRSAVSGKRTFTRLNPAEGFKVCTLEEFWEGEVDNTSVGRNYDFSKSFAEQFGLLMRDSIHLPAQNSNIENSEYISGASNVRNCYLCFSIIDSQDSMYCLSHYGGNDNINCVGVWSCQYCYGCIDSIGCYECQYCRDSENCSECYGCYSCFSCKNCIGCVDLRQRQYCIFNEQVTQVQYHDYLKQLNLKNRLARDQFLKNCEQFHNTNSFLPSRISNTENCTGVYLRNSKNLTDCFHARDCTDCGHLFIASKSRDCWKGWALDGELNYSIGAVGCHNIAFSYGIWNSQQIFYSFSVGKRATHCFGCVGLVEKSYCIFNKQYSKEEYFDLVPRIVAHMVSTKEWGRPLPPLCSPTRYEESWSIDATDDLTLEEQESRGYRPGRFLPAHSVTSALDSSDLPEVLTQGQIDYLSGKAIRCSITDETYNLQRKELEFYLKHQIPVPILHWRTSIENMLRLRVRASEMLGCVN